MTNHARQRGIIFRPVFISIFTLSLLFLLTGKACSQLSYVGSYNTDRYTRGFDVKGDFAYIANWDSLIIVDISDRSNPVSRNTFASFSDMAQDIKIYGDYALVAHSYAGMVIYNISNPDEPIFICRFFFNYMPVYYIEVFDHYALACVYTGIGIVDLSDIYNPVQVGGLATEPIKSAKVVRGTAYIAASNGGLKIIDVSTPEAPSLLGEFPTPGHAVGVDVDMYHVFVADDSGVLSIVDASDPTAPSLLSTLSFTSGLNSVCVYNNIVYVFADSVLYAYNVSYPNAPELLGQLNYPARAWEIIYSDHQIYLTDPESGLRIFEHSYDNLEIGAIEGTVTTGFYEPVPNVQIEFTGIPGPSGISDAYGYYRYEDLLANVYSISYSRIGYHDTTMTGIQVSDRQTTFRNVNLAPLDSYEAVIWIGNPDGSPVTAPIGGAVDVDIYIQTVDSVYIDTLYFPLGVDTSYIPSMLGIEHGQYYPPLDAWQTKYFEEAESGYPNYKGWQSQAFFGGYSGAWPPQMSLHADSTQKILTFSVETIDDPSLIGDTVYCLDAGLLYSDYPIKLKDRFGHTYSAISVNLSPIAFGLTTDYGVISGTITDGAHNPIANAEVGLVDHDRTAFTNDQGAYEFDSLIPGLYRISVSHPLYVDTMSAYQNILRGETTSLNIILPYRGFARGAITDTNAVPVDSVQVQLSGLSNMTVVSTNDGSFVFDYILPGSYDFSFTHPFYVDTALTTVAITRGDTAIIDLSLRPYPFDIYLWYGGEFTESGWADTVYAEAGGIAAIDVWAMSKQGSYAGELGCALGINRSYFSGFLPEQCAVYYPLDTWDVSSFENPVSDGPIYSLSFIGRADLGDYNNPWLYSEVPQKILTFAAAIKNEYDLAGQSVDDIVLGGIDPDFGVHYAKDTTGVIDYTLWDYYPVMSFSLPSFEYVPGDVNMYSGVWPPAVIGSDVTYLVNYFRGISSAHACLMLGLWPSADVNGDCAAIGSDVTCLVNYFRGGPAPQHCPDYPPVWLTPADCPVDMPDNWPNCEVPVNSGVNINGQGSVK